MLAHQDHAYSHTEYFALEAQADYKSEYYRGQIVSMAGASINHNRIVGNVFNALRNNTGGQPCETFMSDLRVRIEQKDFYTYPDVMVVCGGVEFFETRTDTITNPTLIVEVLSESTERFDRRDKFHAYWTLESLAEYVLIDQYQMRVEYFRQVSDREWRLLVLTKPDEILTLETMAVELPLTQIYQNVVWEEPA